MEGEIYDDLMNNLGKYKAGSRTIEPGKLFEHSSAAFNGYMNDQRWNLYKEFAKAAPESGPERARYLEDRTREIGAMTGRSISKFASSELVALSGQVLTAPRYIVSKVEYQLFHPLWKAWGGKLMPSQAAKAIAANYGKRAATYVGAAYILHTALGARVDMDPHSTEFGHAIIGNNDFDIFGVEGEIYKIIVQAALGKRYPGTDEPAEPTLETLGDYAVNKLGRPAQFVAHTMYGGYTKEPYENDNGTMETKTSPLLTKNDSRKPFDWGREAENMVSPIIIQSPLEERGKGASAAPLTVLGLATRAAREPQPIHVIKPSIDDALRLFSRRTNE